MDELCLRKAQAQLVSHVARGHSLGGGHGMMWPMLVELAVGDAYGAGFEYVDPALVRDHNTLAEYVQNPTHPSLRPGRYTDDTQMTLAVAELLVEGGAWSPLTIANRFVETFRRDPRPGYARRFQAFIEGVTDGRDFLDRITPASDKSGAAMRVSPVGLLPDVDDVVERATMQARLTHDTPDGVESACAAALASHYCNYDLGPVSEVGEWVADRLESPRWADPWHGAVGSQGVASVRAALTALAAHGSLSQILRACVDFTGDVDTVATIALAAGSCSSRIDADLPAGLLAGLENGPFGRDYLADIDRRLLAVVAP